MMDDTISLPKAAHLLGLSHTRTYRLCLLHELPAEQRANGRWYVDRQAVERLGRAGAEETRTRQAVGQ